MLDAIYTTIKEGAFLVLQRWNIIWHSPKKKQQKKTKQDELIYILSNCIIQLVTNYKFFNNTKRTLKLYFVNMQYDTMKPVTGLGSKAKSHSHIPVFTHCKTLKSRCEQHQKVKERGCAELTTLTTTTAMALSIYQDAINGQTKKYSKCGHLYDSRQWQSSWQGVL